MTETTELQRQKLIDRLDEVDLGPAARAHALKLRAYLKLPMSVVLEKLWPGMPVTEKVKRLGVTRQAYYGWLSGLYRPDPKQARKLAQHTGFDEDEISGRVAD